jgi:sec-independent protein translocase protein TatB
LDFFGVGSAEILVVILLAAVVLGPERMARAARKAGRMLAELKAYFQELSSGLKEELDVLDELNEVTREIRKR